MSRGLPNRYYTNADDFALERERIFAPTWASVGFASDAPEAGDVYPFEFMGLPLVMMRGRDGVIRVFHNVCRHRGHRLIAGPGKVARVVRCPYHAWTYELTGELRSTPHIGGVGVHTTPGFDVGNYRLAEVRSQVWHDILFINLDGRAMPFADHVRPLEQRWAALWGDAPDNSLRLPSQNATLAYELDINWKLAVENYLEAYHLPFIHPGLNKVSPLKDHEIYIEDRFAGQVSHCYRFDERSGERLPVFPDWPGEKLHEAEYPVLFPNTLLGIQADHLFAMVVTPVAYNRTREDTRLYYAGDEALSERFGETRMAQHRFWNGVFLEDVGAVVGMQLGRSSPGFDGGILSPVLDAATEAFHRWAADRLP